MCLYIITELTGAALHEAQNERFRHILCFLLMFTLLKAHSTHSLKSILTLVHSFLKANS